MYNKNNRYGFKKFLIGGAVALSVFSTSFVTANFSQIKFDHTVNAYYENTNSVSNSDFSSPSYSSKELYDPTSWTFESTNSQNVKHGIISSYKEGKGDLTEEEQKNWGLKERPIAPTTQQDSNNPNYKHLMINAKDDATIAYYTSSNFTLESNSYYKISVELLTINNAQASFYLDGLNDKSVNANLTTLYNNTWTTYNLYIATNDYLSENVNLKLYLGNDTTPSVGAVFFNKVEVKRYSKDTFTEESKKPNTNNKTISLKNNIYIPDPIVNADFNQENIDTNTIDGWKLLTSNYNAKNQEFRIVKANTSSNDNNEIDKVNKVKDPGTNHIALDNNILYLNNITNGKLGLESSEINIPKNELYKLSIWTKSDCNSGSGATLKLVEQNPDENNKDFTPTTASITCATKISSNKFVNNWSENTFIIEGHPLKDTKAKLQIWLGETEETTGYVFVDNITLEKINNEIKESIKENKTVYSYTAENNAYSVIENGNFNLVQKPNLELTYPLIPQKWTQSKTGLQEPVFGVVNTNSVEFDKFIDQNNISISNPGLTPIQKVTDATIENSNNNVLMFGSNNGINQSYTSPNFNLSKNQYYKLKFLVNTQFTQPLNANNGFSIKISGATYTLFNRNNIETNAEWKQFEVYFNTGENDNTSSKIEFSLKDITGFAFIDDVVLETIEKPIFDEAQKITSDYVNIVNLSKEEFLLTESNSDKVFKEIYNWDGKNNGEFDAKYGVINTNSKDFPLNPEINILSKNSNNILMIKSTEDTYFELNCKDNHNIDLNQFYKISISLKTVGISQLENNHIYDKKGNMIDYGATIELIGFDQKFNAISNEDYTTYTFYISPDKATTTNIKISLGDKNNLVSGYVFIDQINFEKIEKLDYTKAQEDFKNSETTLILNKVAEEKEEKEPTNFQGAKVDWLVVPSLLLSISILIALVGAIIRQFKFTRKPKIKTTYDRRKTIEVDMDKRERIELRTNIIKELNDEYAGITKDIEQIYKEIEKEKLELANKQKTYSDEHIAIRNAILIEKENAIKEHDEKIATITDEVEKHKLEIHFNNTIKKLDKQIKNEEKLSEVKVVNLDKPETNKSIVIKKLNAKQLFIKEEIARIEQEIASISSQEEIMWDEYHKAKNKAKQEKSEYLENKKLEKSSKSQESDSKSSNEEETIIEIDDSIKNDDDSTQDNNSNKTE